MILESAYLDVRPGSETDFESAFRTASPLISATPGYHGHELHRCLEHPHRYLLLVRWETLEAHTVEFRGSDRYQEWKRLLHHFYDPFPTVLHFTSIRP